MSELTIRKQVATERRHVLREIAKEKAKTEGKDLSQPSLEADKGQQQEAKEGMPFEQISPEKLLSQRTGDDSAFNWTQFAPFKREKKKARSMNTATIWLMARKEIAAVWREARGTPKKKNPKVELLEREAAAYWEKQEEEKLRQEEVKARFEEQKVKVDGALQIMGERLLKEKDELTVKRAAGLIEDAFAPTGKIYSVNWREDGCNIRFEPWEERWRRSNKAKLPAIYNLKINDRLEVVSCDVIEDEKSIAEQQVVLLEREIQKGESGESLDEEFLGADEEDIKAGIEKKVEKVGRIIELKKLKEGAWLATVELWDQMKIRNVERKGEGPIVTESILAKVVDGTITTSHFQGKKSWEEKATR